MTSIVRMVSGKWNISFLFSLFTARFKNIDRTSGSQILSQGVGDTTMFGSFTNSTIVSYSRPFPKIHSGDSHSRPFSTTFLIIPDLWPYIPDLFLRFISIPDIFIPNLSGHLEETLNPTRAQINACTSGPISGDIFPFSVAFWTIG